MIVPSRTPRVESRGLIRTNVEAARRDKLGPNAGGPFDLVFLDPPYRRDLVAQALVSARDGAWLSPACVIVAEMAADEVFELPEGFDAQDERAYGETRVVVLSARKT